MAAIAVERSVIIIARDIFQDHALLRGVRGADRLAVAPVAVLQNIPGIRRLDALRQLVADQRDRRRAAAGEAFDELYGVFAVGAGHAVAVVRHVQGTGAAQQFIADFMGSGHGAGQGAADSDSGPAGRSLAEPGIERDQLENIDRFEVELPSDPVHPAAVNIPEVVLPQVKERHRGTALGDRVMGDDFINPRPQIRRQVVGLAGLGGGHVQQFVRQGYVCFKKNDAPALASTGLVCDYYLFKPKGKS